MIEAVQKDALSAEDVRLLDKFSSVLERFQKGQRLARGLALDGQTEEQIRAEMLSAQRHIVDLVIEVIKVEVTDEATRDRIARILLERLHEDPAAGVEDLEN